MNYSSCSWGVLLTPVLSIVTEWRFHISTRILATQLTSVLLEDNNVVIYHVNVLYSI